VRLDEQFQREADRQVGLLRFNTNKQLGGRARMKMRPLRDRILVERIEEAEQRIGGIIIPDTAKEKPQSGRVIAVGKGRINDKGQVFPLDVREGETVLFGKYSGSEIKIEGKEYLILREDDVLGVLEGKPERELAAV